MITKVEVEKIASLSKLSLSEDEKLKFAQELSNILGFVEKFNSLDLTHVEATSHAVSVTNVFREDKAVVSPAREDALKCAPETDKTLIQVPQVL